MTDPEIRTWMKLILSLDHLDMARAYRFTKAGHPVFTNTKLQEVFYRRWNEMGAMTPEISKAIGFTGTSPLEQVLGDNDHG